MGTFLGLISTPKSPLATISTLQTPELPRGWRSPLFIQDWLTYLV
ncbi:MAG: hypothetical protein AAF978_06195 [Cyanobacteria bacterium P01_E01_bin.48]